MSSFWGCFFLHSPWFHNKRLAAQNRFAGRNTVVSLQGLGMAPTLAALWNWPFGLATSLDLTNWQSVKYNCWLYIFVENMWMWMYYCFVLIFLFLANIERGGSPSRKTFSTFVICLNIPTKGEEQYFPFTHFSILEKKKISFLFPVPLSSPFPFPVFPSDSFTLILFHWDRFLTPFLS